MAKSHGIHCNIVVQNYGPALPGDTASEFRIYSVLFIQGL